MGFFHKNRRRLGDRYSLIRSSIVQIAQISQSNVSRLVCIESDRSSVQLTISVTREASANPIIGHSVTLSNFSRSSSFRAVILIGGAVSEVSGMSIAPFFSDLSVD